MPPRWRSGATVARAMAILSGLALVGACQGPPPGEDLARTPARADWADWPRGAGVGEVSAVDVDSHGHVFVLHRPGRDWIEPFASQPIAAPVVAMFDASGQLLARWGMGETVMPHGLSVAPDDSVWITDAARQQILRFGHDGTLLEAMGERGVSGDDTGHFGRPTDVAATRAALYAADGYANHRILRFARTVDQWGEKGGGAAGLAIPHSVAVSGNRVVVADRENSHIKIYDAAGRVLRLIPVPGHPYAAKPLRDGRLVSIEGRDAADRQGAVLRLWSADGRQLAALNVAPDGSTRGHDLAIGADGTIYIADVAGRRVLTLPLSRLTGD